MVVFGPIQPDGGRQLSYGYVLPRSVSTLTLPIDQPTAEVDLLIEDTLAVVTAPSLVPGGVEQIENRMFSRYRTGALAAGAPVVIAFPATPFRAERLLPVLIGAIVLALGAGLWIALKKSPQPSAVSPP